MEKRYHRPDGSIVWVHLSVSPTAKTGEPILHHIAVVEDITQRKHAEQRLLEMNSTLEARVHERTSQFEAANRELEGEIGERRRIEAQLRISLEEKDTLLREIHHRVKNNLAVVSGLFYLETTRVTDERSRHVLQEAQHRIRSMAMVHEELYKSDNLAAVSFPDYLRALVTYLLQSYTATSGKLTVEMQLDNLLLDADTAVPTGLIFTELLTNCLKHAFPGDRRGTVSVYLIADADGRHLLRVTDDGVGVAPELDVENAGTLGWRLARALTRQLEGSLMVRGTGSGTEAVLLFPHKGTKGGVAT
jgi:two-component sensor histidine kinase